MMQQFMYHGDLIICEVLTPACRAKMVLTTFVPHLIPSWTATRAKIDALALA